jgi:hypothetical protein
LVAYRAGSKIYVTLLCKWFRFGFRNVESICINLLKVLPVKKTLAGSYIRLPNNIIRKNGLINICNDENICFAHLHFYFLLPGDTRRKHLKNPFTPLLDLLSLGGINFPISMNQISGFESNNPVSCNIFHLNDNNILPLTMTIRFTIDHHQSS